MGNNDSSNKIRRRKVSSSSSGSYRNSSSSTRIRRPSTPEEERNLRKKTSNVRPLYESKSDSMLKRMRSVGNDYSRSSYRNGSKDENRNYSYEKNSRSYEKRGNTVNNHVRNESGKRNRNYKQERDNTVLIKVIKYVVVRIISVSALFAVSGYGYYKYVTYDMPEVTKKMIHEKYISSEPVSINDMPKYLRDAIVSIEDERFYEHKGVDVQALARSLVHNILTDSRQGGSTIEMQLSKNILTNSDVSFERKMKDIHNAYGMDKVMSKDEIIEAYLNNIYFGGNAYGVSAGAKYYFGKNVKDLNLAESAMLVGITNNPKIYSNYSAAKVRQKVILKKMLELNRISKNEYNEALATEVYFKSEIDR